MTQQNPAIEKLASLIKDIQVAMLTTEAENGVLRSRPMVTQHRPFDGTLWFFTGAKSPKAHEIQDHQQVNLSYADPGKDHYVSVSGRASIVHDMAKVKEMWNPIYMAWFPQGVDDPDLSLMKVQVEQAEYWDPGSSRMVQLAGFVKAMVTGEPVKGGESKKITL